jgi:4-aminobutyrate aminotransferase-like enzyme
MRERNVLIGTAGKFGNILKIRPPLVFGREHADIFLEAFAGALEDPH